MTTFLPQNDPDPASRSQKLDKARKRYRYNYDYVSPLALVDKVPLRDEPSLKWYLKVLDRALEVLGNLIEVEKDSKALGKHRERQKEFRKLASVGVPNIKKLLHHLQESLLSTIANERFESLDSYSEIFRKIQLPAIHKDCWRDDVFARMRIAGPNPVVIARVAKLDERFPVTQAHFHSVMTGDSLDAAGREGRLYLADYRALSPITDGSFPRARKFLYAPLALFALDSSRRQLVPVAIQCRQEPGRDNPIFTPEDGAGWLIAKTIVEIADANYHETISHLGRTHLFVEPFIIATHRNLAPAHPLHRLLMPHFEGTLSINDAAHRFLLHPRGAVDWLAAGTIESSRQAVIDGIRNLDIDEAMLPATFASRGVEDPDLLPNYPYRDDALAYWGGIRDWVTSYLALYYPSDAAVATDPEIAAWARDLSSQEGARIPGMPPEIPTRARLADAATLIIYTSSVQHAAVNFPQYDVMSYCPRMPLAGYAPAPTRREGMTEQDLLDMLPTRSAALYQQSFLYMLGTVRYTTLGKYPRRHFRDPRVAAPLEAFGARLDAIEARIKLDNLKNRHPYTTLLPAAIPQSINI